MLTRERPNVPENGSLCKCVPFSSEIYDLVLQFISKFNFPQKLLTAEGFNVVIIIIIIIIICIWEVYSA